MPMVESAFNNCQINVPPRLPIILKQFCKAAIRTQPYDLLKWSSAYFRALAQGEEPPTKIRLECPLPQTISGLTLGFLRVLLRQLGDYNKTLSIDAILRRWDDLCLDRRDLNLIMIIGKFRKKCQVKKFLAIAVGLLGSSLFETMLMVCELFTLEPDGGSAMIPVTLFMEIYGYLAGLRCDGSKRESFDEDPSEFLIFDKPDNGPCPPEEVCTLGRDTNVVKTVEQTSIASEDTEADINVNLESSSKDEQDSDTKQTPDVTPKSSNRSVSSSSKTERNISEESSQKSEIPSTGAEESGKNVSGDARSEETCEQSEKEDTSKVEESRDESSEDITLTSHFYENGKNYARKNSENARKKLQSEDTSLMNYYPNIPGIGPRLTPEEVAAVAIWMTECANLQEGMVGPRNLRHLQCPNLDRSELSRS
ncbi:uncharacterized protein [Venturia canescens]|uniref:uncharacterized protein n=1 Tax=Venturia canescens TaxID=32260 RepID=UPI001C9C688C|nr:uncharacterized protein LOC122409832 [Venturia canescens]